MVDSKKPERFWLSPPPKQCDLCQVAITDNFVDGATKNGPWGCMCIKCHKVFGNGCGTGLGQWYTKQNNGKWLKVEG